MQRPKFLRNERAVLLEHAVMKRQALRVILSWGGCIWSCVQWKMEFTQKLTIWTATEVADVTARSRDIWDAANFQPVIRNPNKRYVILLRTAAFEFHGKANNIKKFGMQLRSKLHSVVLPLTF